MKIVCDSCGAKYAIADEKVRGKVFKIRCKKCSTVIVVRGNSGEVDAAEELSQSGETRTFGYDEQDSTEATASGEAVWHLVIDQDQIGPISEQEVRQRFARGEVDLETYAWREGFGDWAALGTIDVFASLASSQGGASRDMAAGSGEMDRAGQSGDPFASAGEQGDSGDLFGGSNAGDGLFAGAAGGGGDRRMRGERNENSVLFSLNNLAALASDAPRAPAAVSAVGGGGGGGGGGGMAQVGGSEGSGLIDIRSMAQTYMGGRDRAGAGAGNPLSSFSAVEPVTFATQSPVLLPQTPAGGGSNKTLYALIGGLGALLIAGVVVVLLVVLKDDPPATVAQTPVGEADTPPDTAVGEKPPKPDTTPTNPPPNTQNPPDTATPPETGTGATAGAGATVPATGTDTTPKPPDTAGGDRGRNPPRTGSGSSSSSGRREESGSKREEGSGGSSGSGSSGSSSGSKPEGGSGGGSGGCLDEVGCLLADKPPACCSKYSGSGGGSKRPAGGSGGGDANLPEKLGRGDITDGINKVRSGVQACSGKGSGEVKVTVKVEGSGAIGSVTVKSAPNAALGTCVANAVKKAKFAKTQQGATFTYPFVF